METPTSIPPVPGSQPDSGEPSRAAAATITPDPVTAEILRKHEAGAKLTPSEGGKLGAFKRKLKSVVGLGAAEPVRQNPFAASGGGAPVGGVASAQASAGGLAPVPVDGGVARRCASAIINRLSSTEKRFLTRKARAVGVDGNALADLTAKAGFDSDDTALISDLAPDVCAELGIDPRRSALFTVGTVLSIHGLSLLATVMELNEMAERNQRREAAAAQAAAQAKAEAQPKT